MIHDHVIRVHGGQARNVSRSEEISEPAPVGPWRRTAHQWIAESNPHRIAKPFFRDGSSVSGTAAGKAPDRSHARAQTSQAIITNIDINICLDKVMYAAIAN